MVEIAKSMHSSHSNLLENQKQSSHNNLAHLLPINMSNVTEKTLEEDTLNPKKSSILPK